MKKFWIGSFQVEQRICALECCDMSQLWNGATCRPLLECMDMSTNSKFHESLTVAFLYSTLDLGIKEHTNELLGPAAA